MRLSGKVKGRGHRSGGRNDPRILLALQEGELARRILQLADVGFPITSAKIRESVYEYATCKNIKGFSPMTKKGGRKWLRGFLRRHPELKVKRAKQISRVRARAVTKDAIEEWFGQYKRTLLKKGITDPRNIWNVDETSITNIPKPQMFVGRKGKDLLQVVGCERPETSTVVAGVNAAGERMDPMVIHRGQRVSETWKRGAPENALIKATKKGYITNEVFFEWGKMFVDHLRMNDLLGKTNMLILDGHGSHVYNMPFIDLMMDHDVIVFTLLPHTTHVTQPIDQCPLAIFKRFYNFKIEVWCRQHKGKPLPKCDFWKVFNAAWDKAMTPKNIMSGFRITGLYPVDFDVIPDHKFIHGDNTDTDDTDKDESDSDHDDDNSDCKSCVEINVALEFMFNSYC